MHRQPCPQSNVHKDRQIRHRYHTCCLSQCQECACLHTFKPSTPNPKSGLLPSTLPLSASTISASKTSKETFLDVVAAASYLLYSSSDISDVLMVVLAVYSFLFFFFTFRILACIHYTKIT